MLRAFREKETWTSFSHSFAQETAPACFEIGNFGYGTGGGGRGTDQAFPM